MIPARRIATPAETDYWREPPESVRERLHHMIDTAAALHKAVIRLKARALAAELTGRSFNRSLGQLARWHNVPKETLR